MSKTIGKRIILNKNIYNFLLNEFNELKTSQEQSEQELLGLAVEKNIKLLNDMPNLDKETLTLLKLVCNSAKIINKENEILSKLKSELKKIYNEVGELV